MKLFTTLDERPKISWLDASLYRSFRLHTKILLALLPPTILILIATGYVSNWFSSQFLNEAVQRSVRLQTLALAHEVESVLNHCREDLLELPQAALTESMLADFWKSRKKSRGWEYAEVAYFSQNAKESVFLVARDDTVISIPQQEISAIRPDPRTFVEELPTLEKDEVRITPVREVVYPLTTGAQYKRNLVRRVIRLVSVLVKDDGTPRGLIVLGISVNKLRDILSLFNSSQSPIFAYVRSPELRYSYLFDVEGWIWFQSEEVQEKPTELSTKMARIGYSGTFGKPGLKSAFKPFPEHEAYWRMVEDLQQGKHGLVTMRDHSQRFSSMTDMFYVGYAPVRFRTDSEHSPVVLCGVAFVDRSRLGLWAGYRQIDVMFVVTLVSTILISLFIYGLSRHLSRSIFDLSASVNDIQETGELKEIRLPERDYETSFLKYSINNMIATMKNQMEQIRIKDQRLMEANLRERIKLEDEIRTLKQHYLFQNIQEIIGLSPAIEMLKSDILKAASVDADVLIIGETGTGKQLTAEAIHKNSARKDRPFFSVNCGALDENLLLDELFGHVKGAFTEAKTDRKGAFLAAHGGTLFLDEIATASPKVQQALLRAIAARKISPLGSDREYDADVRLIAATNEELKELAERERFREDLYFRLNVITIRTPALRDHSEDIPVLADHFLKEAGAQMRREYVGLTQGALQKMKHYPWPGNVRELSNSITRAVAMTEGSLIHTQDILLEGEGAPVQNGACEAATFVRSTTNGNGDETGRIPPDVDLNARQKRVFAALEQYGEFNRLEYQSIVGDGLPRRTALNDLQDLVKKGVLEKIGRGPAVRYRVVKPSTGT